MIIVLILYSAQEAAAVYDGRAIRPFWQVDTILCHRDKVHGQRKTASTK